MNVQCIRNKIDILSEFLKSIECTVACITEHWLTQDQRANVKIHGFQIADIYTRKTAVHGGTLILTKSGIHCEPIKFLNHLSRDLDVEIAAASIPHLQMVVLSMYRSPSGDIDIFTTQMELALDYILENYPSDVLLVGGDFNVDILSYTTEREKLVDLFESYVLKYAFTEPSRIRTCIDNIYTNLDLSRARATTLQPHISDHLAQSLAIPILSPKTKKYRYVRELNERNTHQFIRELRKVHWGSLTTLSAEDSYQVFHDGIMKCFNESFPLRRRTVGL